MAVDVSRIPNNNKFDPVREAILDLQTQLEEEGQIAYDGTLTISTSGNLTGSGTFTANQSSNTTITIGIDDSTYLTEELNDLTAAVTWANVPDANITQSSVTQHQAALSITESQISDLQSYLVASDLNDYLLLTETGEQTIAGDIVISGDLTISGTTTYINTNHLNIGDNIIQLNADIGGSTAPTEDAGFYVNRGNQPDASFLWDEDDDRFSTYSNSLQTASLYIGTNLFINTSRQVLASGTISSTVPYFTFSGDSNTGVGRATNNKVSLIAEGVKALEASDTGVSITGDLEVGGTFTADGVTFPNDIITSADFSATSNRFKLTLTQEDAGTIEASFDDVVLSESMDADYIPYVKVGGGDGDTTNAVLNDSFLKIDGSTLKLDWGDTVGVYTARDIKMRKDGGGFGKYYEATYAADSVSFLHYESSSDIDTAKIGATTTGRIRINDTYSLPVGDGTSGQVLTTNGTGDLSWADASGGGDLTLQDVTDNNASTTNSITVNGLTSNDDITTTGNLFIGTVGQQNWIAFSGTTGDGGSSATYTTTYIGERIYGGTERSELLIYKGNDGHASTASPDRIRMIGANICFDTYNIAQSYPTDLDGVAALSTTRAMTIDVNQHVSITNGNLAVDTGVIKMGATTVIDSGRAASFQTLQVAGNSNLSGTVTIDTGGNSTDALVIRGAAPTISFIDDDTVGSDDFYIHVNSNNFYVLRDTAGADIVGTGWDSPHPLALEGDTNIGYLFGSRILTTADEGSGSGLDADTLDGEQGTYYDHRRYTDSTNYLGGYYVSGGTEKPNSSVFGAGKLKIAMLRGGSNNLGFGGTWNDVLWMSTYNGSDVKRSTALVSSKYDNTSLWIAKQNYDSASWGTGYLIWNSGNDGSGSGLDADLLDGVQGSSFLRSDANDSTTGQLTVESGLLRIRNDSGNIASIRLSEDTANDHVILEYDGTGSGATNYFHMYSNVSGWATKGSSFNMQPSTGNVNIGATNFGYKFRVDGNSYLGKTTIEGTANGNDPTLKIISTTSNTFNHAIEAFNSNLTSAEHNIVLFGKEGNTKNSGYIGYYWSAAGSNNNFVTIGHWGADDLFRVYPDQITGNSSFRAPIFYDLNNTGYYIHGDGTSRLNILNVNAIGTSVAGIGKVMFPYGAEYNGNGGVTGAFKITLPQSWTNTMMTMKITIFDYSINESFEVHCGGYNYTGSGGYWVNTHAKIIANGEMDRNFNVRFGHDGSKCCILIGETASSWAYPKVVVTEWVGGHSNETFNNWDNGWDISVVTTLPSNIDQTRSNNQIGRYQSIVYDVNNTTYYTNPAGTSYLYDLDMPHLANGTENIRVNIGGQENWRAIALSGGSQDNIGWGVHSSSRSVFSRSGTSIHFPDDGSFRLHTNGWDTEFEVAGGGEAWLKGGLRASIYYDKDNTGYYINPAGLSYVNEIRSNEAQANPRYDTAFYVLQAQHWYGDNSSQEMWLGESGNTVKLRGRLDASVIYDYNDTYYFVNPASDSRQNNIAANRIGINNSSSSSRYGISLYGGVSSGEPTYGLLFTGTGLGTHGSVTGSWATYFTMNNDTSRGWIFRRVGSGNCASISGGGTASFNGDVIAYYSDMRLKTKLGDIKDPIGKIQALNGFYYEPNEVAESYGYEKETRVGLSAQEVEAVLPEIVTDAPIGDGYKTVDYAKLVPVLVEAIKEQQKQIDELKSLINKS